NSYSAHKTFSTFTERIYTYHYMYTRNCLQKLSRKYLYTERYRRAVLSIKTEVDSEFTPMGMKAKIKKCKTMFAFLNSYMNYLLLTSKSMASFTVSDDSSPASCCCCMHCCKFSATITAIARSNADRAAES